MGRLPQAEMFFHLSISESSSPANRCCRSFEGLCSQNQRLCVIDTYASETYMVINDDTIADSG